MTPSETTTIMQPIMQFGFAGLCVALLGIVIWLIKQLLAVIDRNNIVVMGNTQAIMAVDKNAKDARDIALELKNEIIRRPCGENLKVNRDQ